MTFGSYSISSGESKSLSTKMIRSVVAGGIRSLLVAPIPLLLTPLILHKIGSKGYGTWAVFLAINSMTSLADLGLVGTVSKYVAEYRAQQNDDALRRLLDTGLALFSILAVFVAGCFFLSSGWLVRILFRGSPYSQIELTHLFRWFLIVVASNVLILLFASVTTGLQRLDLTNIVTAFNLITAAVISALLLIRGWGLEALVWGYATAAILTLLCYVILTKILLPHIKLNPFHFDAHEARKMFGFSLRLYVTQAAVAVHNQIEKLFLAIFVGVAAAGWYDIASDIALKTRGAIALVLSPVLPAASELGALGDKTRLSELYHRAQKYLAFIGLPVVCYVAANSSAFVAVWLGPTLKIVAVPLAVLTCVNFFNLTTGPGFLIFAGNGNLRPGVQSALLGITLNVVLSAALIYTLGFAGAVIGTSIALVIASFFFLALFYRDMHYSIIRVLRESYLKPLVSCGVALFICWLVPAVIRYSWGGLVAGAFLFGTVYMSLILASRFFDRYDWAKVEAFVPAIRFARRYVPVA